MIERNIIFFDIDGTLLDSRKQLPQSAKEAVFRLKEKGHMVAIATGRAPFMFEDLREELEIDTYVSFNGQYVVLNGEVLYTNPIKPGAIEELTETASENDHPVVYLDHQDMKANVPEHSFIRDSVESLKIHRFPSHDPDYYVNRDLYQMFLVCAEGEEKPYEEQFSDLKFIRWHPYSVDVLPNNGSKAEGIKKITEALGIPKERQYAFGDALNDIEMLKSVPNSVAMGNAVEEVKAAAKYVTKSSEEDGILYGLQLVGLL